MQNQKQKIIEEQDSIQTFRSYFYPKFTPNCSAEQFLLQYDALFQQLNKLDQMPEQEIKKMKISQKYLKFKDNQKVQENQRLIFFIIEQLNNLCTFCHRKQLRIKISSQISKYQKNLANLAIGKKPIKISFWQQMFYTQLRIQELDLNLKNAIMTIFDKIYLQHQMIPHYYLLFLSKPQTLINLYRFQSKLIHDSKSDKTSMPITHKYYLGVIAASTFGSRYLWNFTVKQFIKAGGDLKWIQNGIQQVPKYIKKLSEISYQIAYHFKVNTIQNICNELGALVQDASILQGFYILIYFQFLACVSQVFGLIVESTEYQCYLPQIPYILPSLQSFQTMKKASKKQLVYQKQIAKQFQEMYSWQKDSDKQNYKRVQIQKFQRTKSGNKKQLQNLIDNITLDDSQDGFSSKQFKQSSGNQLMVALQEEQIIQKIKNSQTMKNIQNIYSKYVPFDERLSNVQLKILKNSKNSKVQQNDSIDEQQQTSGVKSQSQYGFIYASQWNFQQHAGNLIQSVMDSSFHSSTKDLIKSLRFINKQKSKNLKIYYESLHNYMYEYVSYINLINSSLSLIEKNYIKLLTRSPFLFNEKSFTKMKEDIQSECKICQPLVFCLEVFSYKLQHSISLSSYVYDKYLENRD